MTSVDRNAAPKGTPTAIAREMVEVAAGALPHGPAFDYLWFGRDNVFAFVNSGQVMARGCQEFSAAAVRLWRDQIRQSMDIGKAFVGVRSYKDVSDLAASLLKYGFVAMTTESIKFAELFSRVAEQASVPVRGRVALGSGSSLFS